MNPQTDTGESMLKQAGEIKKFDFAEGRKVELLSLQGVCVDEKSDFFGKVGLLHWIM